MLSAWLVRRSLPSLKLRQVNFSAGGFTLLEVLLSLFLVALISGILFASFFLPLRAVSAAKLDLVKVEEASVFLTRISEEIAAAYEEISVADTEAASFAGTKDSLSFLSSSGMDLGLEKVGYTVQSGDSAETVTIYRKA
ncbi:MAG: prepilin-type N-terminal cleavage/methylation domain-containing protein, partial [Candidatus Omnitrophica bacterium]|nr:prepilin-type N-terminal cleavage/methylation domain-containing protein [Candidatus Omnitrophota bacterium]